MAVAVPSVMSYLDEADTAKMMAEVRGIYQAAQTTAIKTKMFDERLGNQDTYIFSINGGKKEKVTKVTNYMWYYAQNNKSIADTVSKPIAESILKYLDFQPGNPDPLFKFNNSTNLQGQSVINYENNYKQPVILIWINFKGKVRFVQWGYNDYVLTLFENHIYVKEKGQFIRYNASVSNAKSDITIP